MQEKDIRKKLNQELDKMAPDILDKVLATPIEPVKNEKELIGKNRPLYKQHINIGKYMLAPAMTVIAVCIVILIMIMQPSIINKSSNVQAEVAFNIIIDVNPSISIDVNKDGTIKEIKAGNKDAKKIVKKVNKKIDADTDYNKVVELVVKQLEKNGYFKKKKNAMLVSVVSEDKKASKEKLKEIKEQAKEVERKKKIKCTSVYQVFEETDKVVKVAEKNNVSLGKAALCMKLAEKENKSVNKMCKKTIDELVKTAEKSSYITMDDEIIIEASLEDDETESTTLEMESVMETETVEEFTSTEEETTVLEGESVSGNLPQETIEPEAVNPETPAMIVN